MEYRVWRTCIALATFVFCLMPSAFSSAHEVYILPKETVEQALTMPSLQIFDIISAQTGRFFFWAFISIWAIFTIFSISISKSAERFLDPFLNRLKPYAPLAARLTLGISVLYFAYYEALFGPEIPLALFISGEGAYIVAILFALLGSLLIAGLFTRIAAIVFLALFAFVTLYEGPYMLTYMDYVGLAVLVFFLGPESYSLDSLRSMRAVKLTSSHIFEWLSERSFLILRIAFGTTLIFSSMYAKFVYAQLALETVTMYNLTNYFPFDPPFIVLGAFAIELLLGIFVALGIEIRFASLFLLFWLTLSQLYFGSYGEPLWPHIVLFGGALSLFLHGYDRYTLQWGLMKMRNKNAREPVL